jgi:hypothetical protein
LHAKDAAGDVGLGKAFAAQVAMARFGSVSTDQASYDDRERRTGTAALASQEGA